MRIQLTASATPLAIAEVKVHGVAGAASTDNTPVIAAFDAIKSYIAGDTSLDSDEIAQQREIIANNIVLFEIDATVIEKAFELVAMYDSTYGALFTSGSATDGGIASRTVNGNDLEFLILDIMQAVLDHSFTEQNLIDHPMVFSNQKFESSSFFPGAVAPPENSNVSYTVKINGTHVKSLGFPANYVTEDARRPTGTYLAPGSVATVTVPQSLVDTGASILVGAHTWDLNAKSTIKRMDRVTKKYEIVSETTTIGNPLGGGIYINIPYEVDLGILDITLTNVVRSPYYANTAANQTTLAQWQNVERSNPAPWADFETDKVMMQVPTDWVYAMDDPSSVMSDWDLAMDAISEMFARPLVRSKTVVYMQVDVIMRGDANYPGYPQSNITYDPDRDYGGDYNNFLTVGPKGQTGYLPSVFFHELGHAERFYKFDGESEAFVNFLMVAVHNKKFGMDLNEAFTHSLYSFDHTIEDAAISWMIAENFRNGNSMSKTNGQNQHEFAYQTRGYAKYADIVRLFGWDALEQFFQNINVDYENGINYSYGVNSVPWDVQSLRLSTAAGYDLRPLFHFWGIHPQDPDALAASIAENGLNPSQKVYDLLLAYKALVPADNAAFRAFGLQDYSESKILNFTNAFDIDPLSYGEGLLNTWWDIYDTNEAQAAVQQVQDIIDLYFPDGRPD